MSCRVAGRAGDEGGLPYSPLVTWPSGLQKAAPPGPAQGWRSRDR
jgi:hypothetical protein